MFKWLLPKTDLNEADVDKGLKLLLLDGICSQILGVFTGGAFLVAFALLLGATNKTIGLLAAIGPLTQVFQIPSVYLVDRIKARKAVVVLSNTLGRLSWVVVAAMPWFLPEPSRLPVLLVSLFVYSALGAIGGCAFNSWMRDFVPEKVMGSYFAKRMAIAVALGAALSIAAGVGIDLYKRFFTNEIKAYSILFIAGATSGLIGLYILSRVPEPKMAPAPSQGLFTILLQPFKNSNFRQLLTFLGSWNFAINLAGPFFTVYLLVRLELSMTWVIGLSVLSQMVNVAFLRLWGSLADRFSNKSVLAVSGPLFMLSILMWPFTTMPERHMLTIPLIIAIHVLAGMSTAGVNISAGNIALKAAPKGTATAYLATNALVSGIAATIAPILAGIAADWFGTQELTLTLKWVQSAPVLREFQIPAFSLRGLDFLFVTSFLFGLYAMHRLLAVKEAGEVEEKIVKNELYAQVRKTVENVSTVAGIRHITYFPYEKLKEVVANLPLFSDPKDNSEQDQDTDAEG